MKIAFWSYVLCQGILLGIAVFGKISIWISLIPTFILIGLFIGLVGCMLLFEFMFSSMESCGPIGWDDKDDDDCAKDDKKDSE